MSLLCGYEPLRYDARLIREAAENGSGTLRIRGILQRADAKNQNGRIYPREILEREADRYLKEFVAQRRALGECDHPESTVVNLRNVSHNVVEMHWEGDALVGEIEILDTPSGNIVKNLMKAGIKLGVSSRGVGSVHEVAEAANVVEDDFNLICFDIVSNPSTQGAFLSEGVETALRKNRTARINGLIADFLSEIAAER